MGNVWRRADPRVGHRNGNGLAHAGPVAAARQSPHRLRVRRSRARRPELDSFNPLFPGNSYSGAVGLFGPTNLTDLTAAVTIVPRSNLTIGFEAPSYWRTSIHDGVYATDLRLPRSADYRGWQIRQPERARGMATNASRAAAGRHHAIHLGQVPRGLFRVVRIRVLFRDGRLPLLNVLFRRDPGHRVIGWHRGFPFISR
jgi:hypothetical protein